MRRRATFVHSPEVDFNPTEISIKGRRISFAGLKAAREERLTYGFKELPAELHDVLQLSHELHVRWISPQAYNRTVPWLSTLTPGLHVHYTPLHQHSGDLLCPLLQNTFSKTLKCKSPSTSFTSPHMVSERFASAATSQYYALLSSPQELVAHLQRDVCSRSDITCFHTVALLNIADYIDFDYDAISYALTVTAFWSKPPAVLYDPVGEWTTFDHWNFALDSQPNDRNEVGVLGSVPATDPYDLQLEGFLTVGGEDEKPVPTMFFFPSRHHSLPSEQSSAQEYHVAFVQPTGLHPTLQISFPNGAALEEPANKPAGSICALHTYLTLPSVLFADEYAFTSDDRLFFEAHNLKELRSISGELDLEAPNYVVDKWGSTMLLELATPPGESAEGSKGSWNVTIPLHLRYLEPTPGGQSEVEIPWPIVFWACTAEEGTKFTVNPFDRANLGYDGLFGTRTMFYHLNPKLGPEGTRRLVETIKVPVLDTAHTSNQTVEIGTLLAILIGFAWVLRSLWPGLMRQLDLVVNTVADQKSEKKKQ